MKKVCSFAALLALIASPVAASASVAYPALLRQYFHVETLPVPAPGCTLCHTTDQGGTDTVVRPFGRALLTLGAAGNDAPSLESALIQLESEGIDSDGDGISDADELKAGEDPNVGRADSPDPLAGVPLPRTGCSLVRAPSSSAALWLLAAVFIGGARRATRAAAARLARLAHADRR